MGGRPLGDVDRSVPDRTGRTTRGPNSHVQNRGRAWQVFRITLHLLIECCSTQGTRVQTHRMTWRATSAGPCSEVHTSDVKFAGTDANVSVELVGKARYQSQLFVWP